MQTTNEIVDYYDEVAPDYDHSRFGNSYGEFIDSQERTILTKSLKGIPRSRILDMACGTGRFLNYADYGVDVSGKMLEIAKRKFPQASLFQEDATKTHFESGTFSGIISFHFLMHLDKNTAKQVIDECGRILENDGVLIVDFPSKHRKKLLGQKTEGWHTANDYRLDELLAISDHFRLRQYYGIMFLPIHRLPAGIKRALRGVDALLCRSFLKRYASYIVAILERV